MSCLPGCLPGWLAVAEFLTFEALRPVARPKASTATASPPRVAFMSADRINCNDIELDGEHASLMSQRHLSYISIPKLNQMQPFLRCWLESVVSKTCLCAKASHTVIDKEDQKVQRVAGLQKKSGRFNALKIFQQCFHVNNFYS